MKLSSSHIITYPTRDKSSCKALIAFVQSLLLLLLFVQPQLKAQSVVINELMEEQVRIHQLIYGSDLSSLGNRPLWQQTYTNHLELTDRNRGLWNRNLVTETLIDERGNIRAGVYNLQSRTTINSTLPYGGNNEAAWYGKGVNSELFFGGWITSDYLTVSIRPQLVYQQNMNFETPRFIRLFDDGSPRFEAEAIGDIIDAPVQFGSDPFSTFSMGYTSIKAHYKSFELGYSTEPITWGANLQYPLLFSNNAPGMNHFIFGTRSPIRIPKLGQLEFSYLGAFPQDSDYFVWLDDETEQNRFINGVNIIYSPGFISNFHVGFARAIHTYLDDGKLNASHLGMIFDPFYLKEFERVRGFGELETPRNHLNLIYARWIWEESHFEIYGEYYREDFAWDARDLFTQPRHNSGYSFGVQKLIMRSDADFYRVNVEFVNMTPSFIQEVRPQNYYYSHPDIRQGHTHRGQILGAAIGPGSNAQYISLDHYKAWGRYGLYLRRLSDNNHFHFNYDRDLNRPEIFRQGYGDYWRSRTDLTIGIRGLIEMENFILSGEFAYTKLFNYGRYDYNLFGGTNVANFIPYDTSNLSLQFTLTYRL